MPTPFTIPDTSIASYNWIDTIGGAGYKRFYAAGAEDSVSVKYFLTTNVFDSSGSPTGVANTNRGVYTYTNAGADFDIDFDITFGVPAIVMNADAIVNFTIYIAGTAAADSTPTVTIYHVRGVTETSLGTATGVKIDSGADIYVRGAFKIPLTKKSFAIGDKLRLTFACDNANATVKLYHDPASALTATDADSRTIGTDLTLDIPFKIDI